MSIKEQLHLTAGIHHVLHKTCNRFCCSAAGKRSFLVRWSSQVGCLVRCSSTLEFIEPTAKLEDVHNQHLDKLKRIFGFALGDYDIEIMGRVVSDNSKPVGPIEEFAVNNPTFF
jgi:hypothetical protein